MIKLGRLPSVRWWPVSSTDVVDREESFIR